MTAQGIARAGGWAALFAGVFGVVAAVFLIFVPAAVPETIFSYPLTAAARARVLGPVSRWIVLSFGAFLIVPGLPLLAAGFTAGRLAIAAWLLILAWLGLAMLHWARTPPGTVTS